MNTVKKLVLLALLAISSSSYASQDSGYVERIFVLSSSYGFSLIDGFPNAHVEYECGGNPSAWAVIPAEDDNTSKEMYSAILTAFAAGKEVSINISGCSNNGTGSRYVVSGIYVG